jgi:hypothetical protein
MPTKEEIWDDWIDSYIDLDNPIPLFETDSDGVVQTKPYGKNDRSILKRSNRMESRIYEEGRKVIEDWQRSDDTYDGLIYLMYKLDGNSVTPLYVGKAGKYGKDGESLSANLKGLRNRNTSKFCRWGDGYYYHIGDLSSAVLDHDKEPPQKYERWSERLFRDDSRELKEDVHFWTKAWRKDDVGLYYDFEVTLEHLEYQLIGMASDLYSHSLLNQEGT